MEFFDKPAYFDDYHVTECSRKIHYILGEYKGFAKTISNFRKSISYSEINLQDTIKRCFPAVESCAEFVQKLSEAFYRLWNENIDKTHNIFQEFMKDVKADVLEELQKSLDKLEEEHPE